MKESAGPRVDGGTRKPPLEVKDNPHLVYCGCGHPMHPDNLEEKNGIKLERYSCPQRRWWNAWHHPRAWMAARGS